MVQTARKTHFQQNNYNFQTFWTQKFQNLYFFIWKIVVLKIQTFRHFELGFYFAKFSEIAIVPYPFMEVI